MAAKCEICGKGTKFGNQVSHSKKATKRRWRPNLQKVKVLRDGRMVKMKVCSRCLRTLRKTS